jgi:hypothetical protein
MLQNKSKQIFHELNGFLASSEKVISKTIELYSSLKLEKVKTGKKDFLQAKYFKGDLFLAFLLMPLFNVLSPVDYTYSWLKKQLDACASTLYRFKNDSSINWRSICTQVNKRLLKYVTQNGLDDRESSKCVIIDDTDIEKTGKFIEHVGKIWSHVKQRSTLGFKGLFLCYWDSKSLIGLDFSLHKEIGKNKKRPFGLLRRILKRQYHKKRSKTSAGTKRIAELMVNKIDNAISMIKQAIRNSIKFEYILMDSWFTCDKLIKFAIKHKVHLIGMCKMGKTKYLFADKELSAKAIIEKLRRSAKPKWHKRLGLYVLASEVEIKGTKIKLFYCRNTQRGKWHILLTTDTTLHIQQVYQIYSIRWGIEVFFKETKQYFGLKDCQSRDFDAQIADISKAMLHYNIFSVLKRFTKYETLGELFSEIKSQTTEITLCKRIWAFMLEILALIADVFEIEPEDLIFQVIQNEDKKQKILTMINNCSSIAA